jgi:CHAT domain-containing protein
LRGINFLRLDFVLIPQPIEDELTKANINTIIYVPDNQLRYLPLTALYDKEKL